MNKYHLIGIKGTGMSALAICLKQLGHTVCGSDVEENFFTVAGLDKENIDVKSFNENNITNEYIYIISSAYDRSNIEVNMVLSKGYEYYFYHDFMKEYFTGSIIGVSGTHGKTTTTLMLTKLMQDYPISAVIGDGTGIGNIDYQHFVFESCEYQNHFLKFDYDYLIINNIDFDHPDFFANLNDVITSFKKAASQSKILIINGDDENCDKIDHNAKYTFGFLDNNFLSCKILSYDNHGYDLRIKVENQEYDYRLPQLGLHMIYNFLAALTVYYLIGGDMNNINKILTNYIQPKRRMEEHYFKDNIIVDDYAHHPREIQACINTINLKYPDKKIIIIFEPHTYSRTLALAYEFKDTFKGFKDFYLVNTFTSKRENYQKKKEKLVRKIFDNPKIFRKNVLKKLKKSKNSIIVFLGAGNIRKHIPDLLF